MYQMHFNSLPRGQQDFTSAYCLPCELKRGTYAHARVYPTPSELLTSFAGRDGGSLPTPIDD